MAAEDKQLKEAQGFIASALSKRNEKITTTQSRDRETFEENTKTQIQIRDENYSKLLVHFVNLTKWRNWIKEFFKLFFYLCLIVGLWVLISIVYNLFNKMMENVEIEELMEYAPIIITSLISFVSAIIVVPTIVIQYIFNTKEDENITQIITHTQDHDISGRTWIVENKEKEDKQKKIKR